MQTAPAAFLLSWIFGLLSVAIAGASLYGLSYWDGGEGSTSAFFIFAIIGISWTFTGRFLVLALFPKGNDEPRVLRSGLQAPLRMRDGTEIHTEMEGAREKPLLVMTHDWGLDLSGWFYLRDLTERFRLMMWDLPGLGYSAKPPEGHDTIERFAIYLREVLLAVKGENVILLGHGIGGMTILSLFRLFPEVLGQQVKGVVLMDTTYTEPLRTTMMSGKLRTLERPVIRPLLKITRIAWPIMWFWNGLGYLNGTAHITNRLTVFSDRVTRGQLDFSAWYAMKNHPGVLARGMLAMLDWDESPTLPLVCVPTQIIVGDKDRITLPAAAVHMAQCIPQAKLSAIANAGHCGLLEQGRAICTSIEQWFDATLAHEFAHDEEHEAATPPELTFKSRSAGETSPDQPKLTFH